MKGANKDKGLSIILKGKKLLLDVHFEFDRRKAGYLLLIVMILLSIWMSSTSHDVRRMIIDLMLRLLQFLTT